jgi:hypothetical protein
MSQMPHDEWRIRRSAILRWVRGCCAHEGTEPPAAAVGLPPASPFDYERA